MNHYVKDGRYLVPGHEYKEMSEENKVLNREE